MSAAGRRWTLCQPRHGRLTEAARAQQGRDGLAFLVVLPGPDAAVHEHAEALRAAVAREPVATREGPIQASLLIDVVLRRTLEVIRRKGTN